MKGSATQYRDSSRIDTRLRISAQEASRRLLQSFAVTTLRWDGDERGEGVADAAPMRQAPPSWSRR